MRHLFRISQGFHAQEHPSKVAPLASSGKSTRPRTAKCLRKLARRGWWAQGIARYRLRSTLHPPPLRSVRAYGFFVWGLCLFALGPGASAPPLYSLPHPKESQLKIPRCAYRARLSWGFGFFPNASQ